MFVAQRLALLENGYRLCGKSPLEVLFGILFSYYFIVKIVKAINISLFRRIIPWCQRIPLEGVLHLVFNHHNFQRNDYIISENNTNSNVFKTGGNLLV